MTIEEARSNVGVLTEAQLEEEEGSAKEEDKEGVEDEEGEAAVPDDGEGEDDEGVGGEGEGHAGGEAVQGGGPGLPVVSAGDRVLVETLSWRTEGRLACSFDQMVLFSAHTRSVPPNHLDPVRVKYKAMYRKCYIFWPLVVCISGI